MDHNFLQESAGSTHILNKSRDGNESDSPAGSLCSTEEREMKEAADLIQSPVSKKERKAMVQRKRRRKMKKTHRVIPMDCDESNINDSFKSLFHITINEINSAYEAYQILLNSLDDLYKRLSADNPIDADMQLKRDTFLQTFFENICPIGDLFQEMSTENKTLECEIRCLIEIHLLRRFPRPLHATKIVPMLRAIFFSTDAERVKLFLNDTICDEFSEDLTYSLAAIYGELLIDVPIDLQRFQSEEQLERNKGVFPEDLIETNKLSSELYDFLAEFEAENKKSDVSNSKSSVKRKHERSALSSILPKDRNHIPESPLKAPAKKKRLSRPKSTSKKSPQVANGGTPRRARRRLIHVPETPAEKLVLAQNRPLCGVDDDVVENSPLGNRQGRLLRRESDNAAIKLKKLLKSEEERIQKNNKQRQQTMKGNKPTNMSKIDQKKISDGIHAKNIDDLNPSKSSDVSKDSSACRTRIGAKRKIEFRKFSLSANTL
ncbi:hypothetical protein DdX_11321 [Ditylenchus destructor]|uniref:Uncharacterized protein n=1 Tax=Ditylenchus destructor TaxID=166010 RepID=A0AAD4R4D2_9BILA|nr:hypothetical protein DdX_11321 [Ditylenchus destructor]